MYKRDLKQVGNITTQVAMKHNIFEYEKMPIMQSLDFYIHINKHIKDFKSIDTYLDALNNISTVLKNPEATFYDKDKNTILYFCKTEENVCYAVKLNMNKDYFFLASLYPISEKKLNKYKERSYLKV